MHVDRIIRMIPDVPIAQFSKSACFTAAKMLWVRQKTIGCHDNSSVSAVFHNNSAVFQEHFEGGWACEVTILWCKEPSQLEMNIGSVVDEGTILDKAQTKQLTMRQKQHRTKKALSFGTSHTGRHTM